MGAPGGFCTVVFDLDDTLIVEEATARASLRASAGKVPGLEPAALAEAVLAEARRRWRAGPYSGLCAELGFASWEGLWSTFEGGHPRLDGLRSWAPTYRRDTWRAALAGSGVDDEAAAYACATAFVIEQRRGHPLVAGAANAVRSLSGHRRLGLLTNGPPDIQRRKLDATGLGDCFDAVVISGEVGVAKPDPAVFGLLLEQLGGAPDTTVMVGDNWEKDVLGAQSAGWSSIWVSDGRSPPDPAADVPTVRSVAEIAGLLD